MQSKDDQYWLLGPIVYRAVNKEVVMDQAKDVLAKLYFNGVHK